MRLIFTTLFFAVFATILSAQTVNILGDPYKGNPYTTISAAIEASTNPDDVILISGIHTESITIQKSVTLRGTDPTKDIIQANAVPMAATTRPITLKGSGTPIVPLNITIENLGIRHGNLDANGGGIFVDKITGLATLKNLIVGNNNVLRNGGGIGTDGSNVDIIECTIQKNTATLDGGGIITSSNNGAGKNSVVNIKQSLIDSNAARNGGGLYANGNTTFGNQYSISVNVENSTISNNAAISPTTGNGGGAIFSSVVALAGSIPVVGNLSLKLVHTTIFNNTHVNPTRAGLQFLGATGQTNFSAYNSIILGNNEAPLTSAINFNTSIVTTNIVNCILGPLNNASTTMNSIPTAIIEDSIKNNLTGRTATQAGLDIVKGLQDLGGKTKVYAFTPNARALNFCTAVTGTTIPTIDQRGITRTTPNDAGAFEFIGTSSSDDEYQIDSNVSIYPNPMNEFFKIGGLAIDQVKEVKVYSILGVLEKVFIQQNEFNVSDLSKGAHIVVIDTDGKKVVNRIIIQ
jgi:Secretion system C-terminal sorting domain